MRVIVLTLDALISFSYLILAIRAIIQNFHTIHKVVIPSQILFAYCYVLIMKLVLFVTREEFVTFVNKFMQFENVLRK